EKLFKLPKGWEWTRLNNFSEIKGGKRLPAGETFSTKKTPYIYIQVTNMKNDEIVDENLKYISLETYNKIKQYTISSEDLYITIAGTIGDVGSVPDRFNGMNLTENAAKIVFHDVNKEWLIYSLKSSWSKNQFLDKSVKVAQPKLGLHKISTLIIALPPLKEQQRIVSNLKELMSLCDVLQSHIQQASMQQKQIADVLISQALN
ncbi:MAG: restriction endonuclease subunit S, partial [Crocinitomicaceae bacterium]|nr:restriction endonuclease subunit S [Crocinitomicaceae bacterium]